MSWSRDEMGWIVEIWLTISENPPSLHWFDKQTSWEKVMLSKMPSAFPIDFFQWQLKDSESLASVSGFIKLC